MFIAATIINALAVVALAFITAYYAAQTAKQANAANETVRLMHRQWVAQRRGTIIPIQIDLHRAVEAAAEAERALQAVLAREAAGFSSVTLEEPSGLSGSLDGSRVISLEMYNAISTAIVQFREAVHLSNRQTEGRRPHDAWRDALVHLAAASTALKNAVGMAEKELEMATAER